MEHREFTFHLASCRLGDRRREVTEPFTGEKVSIPIDDGLTADENSALHKILAREGFVESDVPGEGYLLSLSATESLRLRSDFAPGGCGIAAEIVVRKLTDQVVELLLEFICTGRLALMSSTGGDVRLPNVSLDPKVRRRWPDAPVIHFAADIRTWLEKVIVGRPVRGKGD